MTVRILTGDCLTILPTLDAESIDAVVTDPPYDLTDRHTGGAAIPGKFGERTEEQKAIRRETRQRSGFMGKQWDSTGVAFDPATWEAVKRVMKPGAFLLAFGGTRTFHRMMVAIEDAGFEMRDCVGHLGLLGYVYGSGFPKSKNLGDGRGTALKPAWEPVVCARKPYELPRDYDIIVRNLLEVEEALWQSRAGATNSEAATSALTSEAVDTVLSMISSWKRCLDDACDLARTSTTEMKSSLTTDMRTWSYLLSQITPASIIEAATNPDGSNALVRLVDEVSSVVAMKSSAIRVLSAPAIVTSLGPMNSPDGVANGSPGWEPIVLARKPFRGTVAANVAAYGTGALNIDGCRIGTTDNLNGGAYSGGKRMPVSGETRTAKAAGMYGEDGRLTPEEYAQPSGRWPSNVVLSHTERCIERGVRRVKGTNIPGSNPTGGQWGTHGILGSGKGGQPIHHHADSDGYETVAAWECHESCPVRLLDEQSGELTTGKKERQTRRPDDQRQNWRFAGGESAGSVGGASRFFYTAKASRSERNKGLDGMPERTVGGCYGGETVEGAAALGRQPRHQSQLLKLRDDLTPQQREWVLSELAAAGVAL